MSQVLVTGGSGFIASYVILQLLDAGHAVRTTVRRPDRALNLQTVLEHAGARALDRLSFVEADLGADAGWSGAVDGCEYVLHVASPFPANLPQHEDELIVPAREGTLRVLRAARAAGVSRVVLTSSFAAIGYGHGPRSTPFDETSWTNLSAAEVSAYVKSKTLAERAAWEFVSTDGRGLELAVVNPVGVLGPVLGHDYATSIHMVERLMSGAMPACPRLYFGIVDVRDIADLHVRAMTVPAAKGERFLGVSGDFLSMLDVARVLKNRMGSAASRVPTRELPNWLVRLAAVKYREIRPFLPELGKKKNATSAKAQRVLGWQPRPSDDAIVATAESLLRIGKLRQR